MNNIVPMSIMQENIYFEYLSFPNQPYYIIQSIYTIKGRLDKENLIKAAKYMVHRYPIFRTTFELNDEGEPIQVIQNDEKLDYRFIDISDLSKEEQENSKKVFLENDKKQGFDLKAGPLIRGTVIKNSSDIFEIIISYHHILLDGWSASLAKGNFYEVYNQLNEGEKLDNVVDYTFQKYCFEKKKIVDKQVIEYWKEKYSGYKPLEFSGTSIESNKVNNTTINNRIVSNYSIVAMKKYAKEKHFTLSTVCLSIYLLSLMEIYKRDDLAVGIVTSGRDYFIDNIDNAIGNFMKTVPIRLSDANNKSFEEICKEVQESVLNGIYHIEDITISSMRNALILEKNQNVFNDIFLFENYPATNDSYSTFDILKHTANDYNSFPIVTYFYSKDDSLEIEMQLLDTVKENKEEYMNVILNNINRQFASESVEDDIIDMLEESFKKNQNEIALKYKDAVITYAELKKISDVIAQYLIDNIEDHYIAVYMSSSSEAIIYIVSILKAGKAFVPIDPMMPVERCNYILNNSGANYVFRSAEDGTSENLSANVKELNIEKIGSVEAYKKPIIESNDSAYVIYTSGSTGNPKGVKVSYANIACFIKYIKDHFVYTIQDVIYQNHSLSFDNAVWEIMSALVSGASLLIPKDRRNIEEMILSIKEESVTSISLTPSQLSIVLEYMDCFPEVSLGTLKYLFVGSETVPISVIKKLKDRISSECAVYNEYGPTETTITSSLYRIPMENLDEIESYPSVPIGMPIAECVFILDNSDKEDEGELLIGGPCVTLGYLNDEEKTNKVFVQKDNVELPGKYYRTGDYVKRYEDGNYIFLHRVDDQVKIRGFRIEISEVEKAIEALNIFKRSAVVAVWNEENCTQKLVAFYVGGKNIDVKEIRRRLMELLPEYMIPGEFQQIEAIPLNSNGKVERKKLVKYYQEGVFDESEEMSEKALSIIERVLECKVIDEKASFYSYGGDSLKCAKLAAQLKKAGYTIEFYDIIHSESIKELIDICLSSRIKYESTNYNLNQVDKDEENTEEMRLNNTQKEIVVDCLENPSKENVYLQEITFDVHEILDKSLFKEAFNQTLRFCPILLGSVGLIGDSFHFQNKWTVDDILEDYSAKSKEDFNENVNYILSKGINIFSDKLFRMYLFEELESTTVSIIYHQILLDGISINNLINTVFYVYNQLRENDKYIYTEQIPTLYEIEMFNKNKPQKEEVIDEDAIFDNLSGVDEMYCIDVASETINLIDRYCKKQKITINSFFFTLNAAIIVNMTKKRDFVLGFAVDGRNPSIDNIYKAIGNLIQTVLIKCDSNWFDSGHVTETAFFKVNLELMRLIADTYNYDFNQKVSNYRTARLDCMYSFHNYYYNNLLGEVQFNEHRSTDILPYAIAITVVPGKDYKIIINYDHALKNDFMHSINVVREDIKRLLGIVQSEKSNMKNIIMESIESITHNKEIKEEFSLIELGFNSLSIAILYKKLIDLGVEIDFSDLLNAESVQDIVDLLEQTGEDMHNAGKVYSLNETQIEIFMLQKLNDDRSLLVNQEQYTFNLLFDEKKLCKCVEDVVISNPILRSVVREKNNIPVQIVMDKMQNSFSYVYCDNIDDLCDAEVRKVSEINTNTMFSILVIASSKQTSEFIVTYNHLIMDGVSCDVILHEIFDLYFNDKKKSYINNFLFEENSNVIFEPSSYWKNYFDSFNGRLLFENYKRNNEIKNISIQLNGFNEDKKELKKRNITTNSFLVVSLLQTLEKVFHIDNPTVGLSVTNNIDKDGRIGIGCLVKTIPYTYEVSDLDDETMKKVQNELFTLYKNSPQFGALKSSVRYDVLYSFEAEVIQKKDFYEDYITDISSVEKTNVPLSINAIEYKDELVIEISYDNSIELEILDFVDRWEKTLNKYGKEKNVQTDSYRHAIIEAWKDVLQVDIDDDLSNEATFFDLGGDSLQLFSLLKKLNIEYDFDVSLTELLENQSLMQLQKVLKKKHQY